MIQVFKLIPQLTFFLKEDVINILTYSKFRFKKIKIKRYSTHNHIAFGNIIRSPIYIFC